MTPNQQEVRRWPLFICPVCGEGTTNNVLHLHSQPEHKNERVDVFEAAPCKALVEAARRLSNVAAAATCYPRDFHENKDHAQQELGQVIAEARGALASFEEGNDGR